MRRTFRLSEEAERDLYEAAHFIAEDNLAAAARFLDCFEATCTLLTDMPESGSVLRTTVARLRDIRLVFDGVYWLAGVTWNRIGGRARTV